MAKHQERIVLKRPIMWLPCIQIFYWMGTLGERITRTTHASGIKKTNIEIFLFWYFYLRDYFKAIRFSAYRNSIWGLKTRLSHNMHYYSFHNDAENNGINFTTVCVCAYFSSSSSSSYCISYRPAWFSIPFQHCSLILYTLRYYT